MRVEVGFRDAAELGFMTSRTMKFRSKKGWKSLMPLRLGRKSATHFCLFPQVRSASQTPGNAPVYLNVYDLTPMNGYVYWAGLGIYHTGVEVHGVEYAFGAHDYPTSGVFEVEPRQCPGFRFRKSIFIGTTCLDPMQVRGFMELHSVNYHGDTYHLIVKNCNHFCKDVCYKLTGNKIPKWVNRLARIGRLQVPEFLRIQRLQPSLNRIIEQKAGYPRVFGSVFQATSIEERETPLLRSSKTLSGALCNCLLPEALKISAVRHDSDSQAEDGEKRSLRSAFSCLSSISTCQRQFSASSLFLPSPLKGCLPPWEFKRSGAILLKER